MRKLLPSHAGELSRCRCSDERCTYGAHHDSLWTAVQGLFHPTRLNLVTPPNRVEGEPWMFVYGGSCKRHSVGSVLSRWTGLMICSLASVGRLIRHSTSPPCWLQGGHRRLAQKLGPRQVAGCRRRFRRELLLSESSLVINMTK